MLLNVRKLNYFHEDLLYKDLSEIACGKKQKRWDHLYGEDHNWLTLYGLFDFFFNSLFWIYKDDLPKNVV